MFRSAGGRRTICWTWEFRAMFFVLSPFKCEFKLKPQLKVNPRSSSRCPAPDAFLSLSSFSDPVWGRSGLCSATCSVIPGRKRWTHCLFACSCHAAPLPLLTAWLPQSGVKLSPPFFFFLPRQVPQRWNLFRACLALESYSGIVLWVQHTQGWTNKGLGRGGPPDCSFTLTVCLLMATECGPVQCLTSLSPKSPIAVNK